MILLSRAVGLEGDSFTAEVDVTEASPFCEGGDVPAWVGLEYMAQAVALFSGVESALAGRPPRPGLLLGARAYDAATPSFPAGQTLTVRATKLLTQAGGVSAVDCAVLGARGETLAQAQLTVLEVEDLGTLEGGA